MKLHNVIGSIAIGILVFSSTIAIGSCLNWCSESSEVAREELGPKALNQKYEWFKDTAEQIKSQKSSIQLLKSRNEQFVFDMGPRNKWNRSDSDTYAQFQTELTGAMANCNRLIGEYNAEMKKWHTKFINTNSDKFDLQTSFEEIK